MQRTLELSFDRLVIGSDLSALSYCYVNQCPAVYLKLDKPYRFNQKQDYDATIHIWNKLAFMLANYRLLPFGDKVFSIRLDDDNLLKVVTKGGVVCNVKYNNLIISNDIGVEGLPPPSSKTSTDNWVIDWFNIKANSAHGIKEITDSDSFVNKICFYDSERHYKTKDIVALSVISDSNILSNEYTQNIARIKALKMLKENGVKGAWDNRDQLFKYPRLTATKRDVYPLGKNIYNDLPQNINMLYEEYESILQSPHGSNQYFNILNKYGINK